MVTADSEYETLEQLVEAWTADPTSISWGGGSAGGTDHILVGLLAQAAGVDPSGINYVAHSGGGEALNAILSGAVTAGVSGVSEFTDQVEAGEMRWLAVSGEAAPEGIDAPTIADCRLRRRPGELARRHGRAGAQRRRPRGGRGAHHRDARLGGMAGSARPRTAGATSSRRATSSRPSSARSAPASKPCSPRSA